tara:strand:- start:2731 stop:2958 length:228 start_codon:yes stop_codon:yes gene_type:complete
VVDFTKLLNSSSQDQKDEIAELREMLFMSNKMILEYIDESRQQLEAIGDRMTALEAMANNNSRAVDMLDDFMRNA